MITPSPPPPSRQGVATATQPPSGITGPPAAVAGIAGILVAGLGTVATATALAQQLAALGLSAIAIKAVLGIAGRAPATFASAGGPVARQVAAEEVLYRASYLIAAARRIDAALAKARRDHEPIGPSLRRALQRERRWWSAHLFAKAHRAQAADQVDDAAAAFGPLLGWQLGLAGSHTPVCRAADGHNFEALRRPLPGWPGSVHPRCSCHAVAPWPGATSVDVATRGLVAAGID